MAQPGLFAYAPHNTPLQRLDPRVKLPALIALQAVAFTLSVPALVLMAAATTAGYRSARLHLRDTLRRMLPLATLLAVIIAVSGGANTLYALRIAVAVLIANLFTAVTPTTEIAAVIVTVLRPLVPRAAAHTALAAALAVRFIEVLFAEAAEAKAAVVARGCPGVGRRAAAVAGSVLQRLPQRSEEITAALTARGYDGTPFTPALRPLRTPDFAAVAALAAFVGLLLVL